MVIKNGTFLEATIVAFEKESQQGEKKAELATIRDEALQAQLKDAEAKAKARLRKAEESAQLAQQRADLAACQRSAIETQLKDAEEKAHLAQKITDLVAAQDGPTKREALKKCTDSVNELRSGRALPLDSGQNAEQGISTQGFTPSGPVR